MTVLEKTYEESELRIINSILMAIENQSNEVMVNTSDITENLISSLKSKSFKFEHNKETTKITWK